MAGQFWAMQKPPTEMEMLYIMLAKIVGRSCQLDVIVNMLHTYRENTCGGFKPDRGNEVGV